MKTNIPCEKLQITIPVHNKIKIIVTEYIIITLKKILLFLINFSFKNKSLKKNWIFFWSHWKLHAI